MDNWLKTKTAGLPRWAWVSLFSGAIILGLYLRSRSAAEGEEPEGDETPEGLDQYEGTDSAGGLASAGLLGPASGGLTPVQTPYLPEGLTEIFAQQSGALASQQEQLTALAEAALAKEPSERSFGEPVEPAIYEPPEPPEPGPVTGGGAPHRQRQNKARQQAVLKRKQIARQRKRAAQKARRESQRAKRARRQHNQRAARAARKRAQRAHRKAKRLAKRQRRRRRR